MRAFVVRNNQCCGVSQMYPKDRVPKFKIVAIRLGFAIQLTHPASIIRMCRQYHDEVTRSDRVER